MELIKEDSVIESLAEKVYELQDNSSDVILALKAELNSVETKLTNIANAIAQGHYSKTTNKLMQDLEAQKQQLEENICKENIAHPILSKEQILFLLQKLQRINVDTMEGKQKLIDCFVNSIYLYDDYFIITFNYKGDSKTVTFSEVESSSIKTTGLPNNNLPVRGWVVILYSSVSNKHHSFPKKQKEKASESRTLFTFINNFNKVLSTAFA